MNPQYTRHKISRLSSREVLLEEIARLKSENTVMKSEYSKDKEDIRDLRKKLMKTQDKVIKLSRSLRDERKSSAEIKREYEEYTELAESVNEEAAQKVESLKLVNYDLNEKFKRLYNENAKLSSTKISTGSENQIARLVLGFGTFFGDMLEFSFEAIDNKKHYTLTQLDDAWVLIKSLPFLWELLYDRKDPDFVNTFKSMTGFRFSLGETSYFKKDPNKMKDREFTFDDGKYDCLWHIGKMTHDYGVSMRCYFYPDSSIEKIRVGYLGEHL